MKISDIEIYVQRKKRKTVSIKIVYGPKVIVSAPLNLSEEKLRQFITDKQDWIIKKYRSVKDYPCINLSAIDGKTVRIFGKEYIVKSEPSSSNKVILQGNEIIFFENGKKQREKLFENFQKKILQEKLLSFLTYWQDKMKLKYNGFIIRKQKSRWGWCNLSTKILGFNLHLVFQSEKSIESVVVHELAHLKHSGHGKDFYNYLLSFMPDYKEHNSKLVMPR